MEGVIGERKRIATLMKGKMQREMSGVMKKGDSVEG